MSSFKLNEDWDLWYHSLKDQNWGKNSYQKLLCLKSLFDYKLIVDKFKQNHYQNGMFFCMKKNVFPNWEDPINRQGGCLSFKVPSKDMMNEWNQLLLYCINNNILKDKNEEVTGISISPKKEFNIIKIWFSCNKGDEYKQLFDVVRNNFQISKSIFRAHSI